MRISWKGVAEELISVMTTEQLEHLIKIQKDHLLAGLGPTYVNEQTLRFLYANMADRAIYD